jgi:ribonuclease T1
MSPARFRSVGAVALVLVAVLVVLLVGRGVGSGTAEPAPAISARSASPATKPAATRPARDPASGLAIVDAADLPSQARRTLALIDRGGPFPYAQDGTVFGNVEGVLPRQPRGWYHEYTVRTPGESDRGPRRIVTGGAGTDRTYFWTDDHYATFARIRR